MGARPSSNPGALQNATLHGVILSDQWSKVGLEDLSSLNLSEDLRLLGDAGLCAFLLEWRSLEGDRVLLLLCNPLLLFSELLRLLFSTELSLYLS